MKFLVDSLPYYGDFCPFKGSCCREDNCPSTWAKEKVYSESNPHECKWLREKRYEPMKYFVPYSRTIDNGDGTTTITFEKEN